jgi:hypothetical protein
MLKASATLLFLTATISGCTQPPPPQPQPKTMTPAQKAKYDEARAEMIRAECALYANTSVTPEGC